MKLDGKFHYDRHMFLYEFLFNEFGAYPQKPGLIVTAKSDWHPMHELELYKPVQFPQSIEHWIQLIPEVVRK